MGTSTRLAEIVTVDRRARRAIWVGGPADGHVDDDHTPTADGTMTVPEFEPGVLERALQDGWSPSPADRWREVEYRGRTIRDLDGHLLTVYAPARSGMPDVSLFAVARTCATLRLRTAEAEERATEAEGMARVSLRQADELAGRLRDARLEVDVLRDRINRSSTDA